MSRSLLCYTIVFLLVSLNAQSQYRETIVSSRPGQAFTPLTPGKDVLQVQTGLNIGGFRTDFDFDGDLIDYASLFRYGIQEQIELRTSFNLSRVDAGEGEFRFEESGFSQFTVGTKINIINGSGRQPSLALQADFALPIVKEEFRNDNVATTLVLAHTQEITDGISVSANAGAMWDGNGDDSEAVGTYVLNFGFALPANFGTFIETYGTFDADDFDILFDTGLSYLVNPNMLLDLSGGYGNNDQVKTFFFDFGLSWRVGFGANP